MWPSDLLLTRTIMPEREQKDDVGITERCNVEERRIAIRRGKMDALRFGFRFDNMRKPSISVTLDSIRRKRRLIRFFSHAYQPHCFASLCFFSLSSYNLQHMWMSISEPESSIHSLFSEVEDEHLQDPCRRASNSHQELWTVDLGEAHLVGQWRRVRSREQF